MQHRAVCPRLTGVSSPRRSPVSRPTRSRSAFVRGERSHANVVQPVFSCQHVTWWSVSHDGQRTVPSSRPPAAALQKGHTAADEGMSVVNFVATRSRRARRARRRTVTHTTQTTDATTTSPARAILSRWTSQSGMFSEASTPGQDSDELQVCRLALKVDPGPPEIKTRRRDHHSGAIAGGYNDPLTDSDSGWLERVWEEREERIYKRLFGSPASSTSGLSPARSSRPTRGRACSR